tara:strand:+ start:211 stop:450 length:240 start_codon:yes stop_codon:yes gene_type:complete
MSKEEKAKELLEKMLGGNNHYLNKNIEIDKLIAKQCALICVDEILDVLKSYGGLCDVLEDHNHWQEVKQEILNQNKEDE